MLEVFCGQAQRERGVTLLREPASVHAEALQPARSRSGCVVKLRQAQLLHGPISDARQAHAAACLMGLCHNCAYLIEAAR